MTDYVHSNGKTRVETPPPLASLKEPPSGTQEAVGQAMRIIIGKWTLLGIGAMLSAFLVPATSGFIGLIRRVDVLVARQTEMLKDIDDLKSNQGQRPRVELVDSWFETIRVRINNNTTYNEDTRAQLQELRSRFDQHVSGSTRTSAKAAYKKWVYTATIDEVKYTLPQTDNLAPLGSTRYVTSRDSDRQTLATSMEFKSQGQPLALVSPVPFRR